MRHLETPVVKLPLRTIVMSAILEALTWAMWTTLMTSALLFALLLGSLSVVLSRLTSLTVRFMKFVRRIAVWD